MAPEDFISWLAPAAQRVCREYKLFASVCVAQGAIESAWGEARIGEYNIFGRKAAPGDKFITKSTQEYFDGCWVTVDADFKDYDSLDEAVKDYCLLICEEPVYSGCMAYLDDLEGYTRELAAHYATDPDYADKLLATIRANELTQYD